MEKETINSLRKKIGAVDDEILRLLNDRARIVQEVGKIKSEAHIDYYSPRREEEILLRLRETSSGPFPGWAIRSVFREIISSCRALEAELKVAYLGPPATFSHLACIQRFGSSVRFIPENTIHDVFEAVERGRVDYGVVPIENSTEGPVNQTLDMFIQSEVKICSEILTRISHDLLSQSGDVKGVEKIYSHPQALAQCREWIRRQFPHVALEETGSTARAAETAAKDPKGAAIAGPLAAQLYGLKAVATQIEDNLNNYTRFLVLGLKDSERTGRDKTSISLSLSHSPGALFEGLRVFEEKRLNLTKIESRPTKDKPWEYVFFIDVEGHAADAGVFEALEKLRSRVLSLKLLGSYPQDSNQK
jgi:chorismate mutase / prephenate dehydratase